MDGALLPVPCLLYALAAVLAAVGDARARCLPNGLALVLGALACVIAGVGGGPSLLVHRIVAAFLACAALTLFELLWRRAHGVPGLGMGDVKALFSLLVLEPVLAGHSFFAALLLLAGVAIARDAPSLPLLPFLFASFAVFALLRYGDCALSAICGVGML